MSTSPILFSYGINGDGCCTPLEGSAVGQQLKDDALAWVHLDARHPDIHAWLKQEISYLDPFIVEALLVDETRPRMTQIGDGALMILRGVNLNENAEPEDMVSVRLWADSHRIITLRRRPVKAVADIEEKLLAGMGPKDSGDLVCMLAARLFERMQPVLSELDDTTDKIEECLLESANVTLRESIVDVRKQAIIFRRYMAPQRDAIEQLRMSDLSWINDMHKRHLQESYNHVSRYIEDLDTVRERAQIIKDELANILTDKLNKNMYTLSVIAAIFLPLGFLTGLLGINVGGIPGAEDPEAFWHFLGMLSVLVAAQVVIFKRLGWF